MTTEQNRAEFEEWAKSDNYFTGKKADGSYEFISTTIAWKIWLAARERQSTKRCAFCNELPQTDEERRICDELRKQDKWIINPPTTQPEP
jgi:hypothetical protein